MPFDRVQQFEKLQKDAQELQSLADSIMSIEEVVELTSVIDSSELVGYPVAVSGGLLESSGFDEYMNQAFMFVPLDQPIEGIYMGLGWRHERIAITDDHDEYLYRLCHAIGGRAVQYLQEDGNLVRLVPVTYVTAEGSDIEITSLCDSHDFRRLENDAFCMKVDQIAIDDELDLTQKAAAIARLFTITDLANLSEKNNVLMRQRISYVNHLELFAGATVVSPVGLVRNEYGYQLLDPSASSFTAKVGYVVLDIVVGKDGVVKDNAITLSYEAITEEYGHVTLPHISGKTKVIPPAQ